MAKRYEVYLDSYKGESVVRLTIRNSGNQHMPLYTICGNADDMAELALEILNAVEKLRAEQAEIKHLKREIEQLKKEQARDNLEIKRLEERYKNLTYSVLEVGTEKCDE